MKFLLVHLFSVKTVVNQTCMGRYDFIHIIAMFISYAHFFSFERKYSTENMYNLLQCRLYDIMQLGLRISFVLSYDLVLYKP